MNNPLLPNARPGPVATDLSADLDLPDNLSDSARRKSDKNPDNLSGDYRTRIEAKCSGEFPDVENILKNWTLAKTKWRKLVQAIRLIAALDNGNLAASQEIYPGLKGLLSDQRTSRPSARASSYKTPESKDSESESKDPEKEKRITARMVKLAHLTQMDLRLYSHEKKLRATAEALDRGGDQPYTPEELDRCVTEVIPKDYRYKPGEAPSLFLIADVISKVRALPAPTPVPTAQEQPPDDPAPDYAPIPAYRGEYESTWLAAQGELKIIMGASYAMLIGPLKLVAVIGGRFVFVAPTPGVKEAVKSRAVGEIQRRMESICKALGKLPAGGVSVEIYTEEEYKA